MDSGETIALHQSPDENKPEKKLAGNARSKIEEMYNDAIEAAKASPGNSKSIISTAYHQLIKSKGKTDR